MNNARVWTVGEALAALVSADPVPAEHANALRVSVGGAEFNVAVGLARLGHLVTWTGVVGADPWGRRVVRELRAEGVGVQARTTLDAPTGAYLREHRTRHLTRATYLRRASAGSQLDLADVDRITPAPGDLVHLTGVTPALSETARSAWLHAAKLPRAQDAHLSLDINFRSTLWSADQARKAFEEIAPYADVVMASPDETGVVTGTAPQDAPEAARLLKAALSTGAEVVIKNGSQGSVHLSSHGEVTYGRALPTTVQDLVGAGDAFAAGYLSGLLDGLPVPERLARGHACAAFVVATVGDWEGAPRRSELQLADALLDQDVHR